MEKTGNSDPKDHFGAYRFECCHLLSLFDGGKTFDNVFEGKQLLLSTGEFVSLFFCPFFQLKKQNIQFIYLMGFSGLLHIFLAGGKTLDNVLLDLHLSTGEFVSLFFCPFLLQLKKNNIQFICLMGFSGSSCLSIEDTRYLEFADPWPKTSFRSSSKNSLLLTDSYKNVCKWCYIFSS